MCGISTIDFKNPCHWSWLVGRVFAVGGPTYTRQTVYGHLVNLVNFSTFHCHLINFSSLSFHCKLFKVHTMELVSHKIASGHSWRIRWPKDHRQNKWGNTFALLSVKYLFKHFSPAPLFFLSSEQVDTYLVWGHCWKSINCANKRKRCPPLFETSL